MKIVLNLEAAGWLGGRYYLRNLGLALATLPEAERPDVLILARHGLGAEFAEIGRTVETIPADAVVFPNWGLGRGVAATALHWIPDLQHRILPQNFGRVARLRRDRGYRRLGSAAALIVVSSEVVRDDIARAYPHLAEKLRVVHFTTVVAAESLLQPIDAVLARHGLPGRFMLVANQFWAHKNHTTAFAAASQFNLPLVCTGELSDDRDAAYSQRLRQRLANAQAESDIRVLGVVEREDYLQLVRAARVVLQPSLFEGWSSIVEDARAFGRPIALSSIPVHREQDPPLATYFDPHSATSLAAAVREAANTAPLPEQVAFERQWLRSKEYASAFLDVARQAHASS